MNFRTPHTKKFWVLFILLIWYIEVCLKIRFLNLIRRTHKVLIDPLVYILTTILTSKLYLWKSKNNTFLIVWWKSLFICRSLNVTFWFWRKSIMKKISILKKIFGPQSSYKLMKVFHYIVQDVTCYFLLLKAKLTRRIAAPPKRSRFVADCYQRNWGKA